MVSRDPAKTQWGLVIGWGLVKWGGEEERTKDNFRWEKRQKQTNKNESRTTWSWPYSVGGRTRGDHWRNRHGKMHPEAPPKYTGPWTWWRFLGMPGQDEEALASLSGTRPGTWIIVGDKSPGDKAGPGLTRSVTLLLLRQLQASKFCPSVWASFLWKYS